MKTLIPCLAIAILIAPGAARAQCIGVADPVLSTVPNVRVAPGGGLIYEVTIVNGAGLPCVGAVVDLVWAPASVAAACPCPGSPIPAAAAVTDAAGVAAFDIAAGGCIDPAVAGTGVDVFVDGGFLVTVGQVSPDFVDALGAPMPDCAVGLGDAVSFTGPLAAGAYTFCTDLNSDLRTSLLDAVVVTPFVLTAAICP